MRHSRVVDYVIYISAGMLLCAVVFVPMILGVDMNSYFWKIFTLLSTSAMIGWLGYELRSYRGKPQLWAFLTAVAIISAFFGWWLHHIHYRGGTPAVSVMAVVAAVSLEFLFRFFMGSATN